MVLVLSGHHRSQLMELGYGLGINRTFEGTSKDMSIFLINCLIRSSGSWRMPESPFEGEL